MYELERRAIFSKKWLLVTHKLRFPDTGSYVKITETGYTFFLVRDRQGAIRAHHNICRHRAYPIVEKESGKASILACKYHGWSYGFDGHLAKAPKYQEVPAFNKEENGLYRIHVHVDALGFVYVNLDAGETPAVSWEQDFATVDEQPRLLKFDMTKYTYDHSWEMTGDYNWKVLADNYNEASVCYHCPTGHPALPAVTDLSKYWVETAGTHIQHYAVDRADAAAKSLGNVSTYYYPNASSTVTGTKKRPHFFFIQRCVPISATQTHMEYEVYRNAESSAAAFTEISDFFKDIMREDKELCNGAQKNLNAGIFLNGELHPRAEKGPLFFQMLTRNLVNRHYEEEQAAGAQIWPAVPRHRVSDMIQNDVDLCGKLECAANSLGSGELAW
ncbi:iron-sulfur cluster-binding protein, rieske family domain protein [Cordyceps militaris CM01]|uniref:Choline monooxygenase, chloroplastic n=1 Tax=Cordyceps militaris (strain CM01) TaxID=983644 RepID=G3JHZ1_CORMM|nr:iron-sulfur cluster-binding protein, rieske family domain protein [Cordyceps militaris CM01]EGX91794.1 iron-sulfur cluster-binding protein, rieske family domain protein [Cordyceps militaris CM01]